MSLCPRCGHDSPVEVHGHIQCGFCHLYLEECCTGEQCHATRLDHQAEEDCTSSRTEEPHHRSGLQETQEEKEEA